MEGFGAGGFYGDDVYGGAGGVPRRIFAVVAGAAGAAGAAVVVGVFETLHEACEEAAAADGADDCGGRLV